MNHMQPVTAPPAAAVKEGTTASFMADVIEASSDVPIIVDFWAPWCGPCKQMTPVLEKAVAKTEGKVRLVKINVDHNKQLAQNMRIQSIPAVFVFYRGQPVDGFVGAVPESQLAQFVDHVSGMAGGDPSKNDVVPLLGQAESFAVEGKFDHAEALFREVLRLEPEQPQAVIGMIKALAAGGKIREARAAIENAPAAVKADKSWAGVEKALILAEKMKEAGPADMLRATVERDPANLQARYDYAMSLYAGGRKEEGIDQLIETVRRDRKWNEELARKELVNIFEALGSADPLTVAGRKKLSSVLFS